METGAALTIFLMSAIGLMSLSGSFNFRVHGNNDECPSPSVCVLFEGVPSVFCNGSELTEVPKGIPNDTQFLDISNNSIKHITYGVLTGLLNLTKIDLKLNGFQDNSIAIGALELPNLLTVDLSLNNFTEIPKFLPISVKQLFITFNMLTELHDNSFVLMPRLEYLDFSNNYLSKIEPWTFLPLEHLQTIYFLYNRLTDDSFPPNVFMGNTNLKMLMFCFNQLENMVPDLPSSLEGIGYVGNKLSIIPTHAFANLPNLANIEIWQNEVSLTLTIVSHVNLHQPKLPLCQIKRF